MLELSEQTRFDLPTSGLRHGDGLFETLRVERGVPCFLDRHLARMEAGLAFLGMPGLPPRPALEEFLRGFLGRAGSGSGALRLVAADGRLSFFFESKSLEPPAPVKLMTSRKIVRNSRSLLRSFKTLSYLENLLLVREAEAEGAFDAVALNETGLMTDGGRTNLFVVQGERVLTPPASSGCLPGVARSVLLDARMALEANLLPAELRTADAVFLTNALRGVIAVNTVLPDGDPGEAVFPNPRHPAILRARDALFMDDVLRGERNREIVARLSASEHNGTW